jgi:hypothetical protein
MMRRRRDLQDDVTVVCRRGKIFGKVRLFDVTFPEMSVFAYTIESDFQETIHSIASFAEGGDYRGGNDRASQRE